MQEQVGGIELNNRFMMAREGQKKYCYESFQAITVRSFGEVRLQAR
jgi:hypothetical protein